MIRLTLTTGQAVFLHHDAIARVTEASTASQWHGTRAYVTTFDNKLLEVCNQAFDIAELIAKARKESIHGK
jgi:hypothetical protein